MRVYVTGPGDASEYADAVAALTDAGYEVTDKWTRSVEAYGTPEAFALAPSTDLLRRDVTSILECDGVAIIGSWKKHKPTKIQRLLAVRLGLFADELATYLRPGGVEAKRATIIFECSVCGASFTRGRGRPPRTPLCPDHSYLKPSKRRAEAVEVIEAPERDEAYAERVSQFWKFTVERHSIYLKRKAGETPPWTLDPLLATRFFTNVYRSLDPGTEAFRVWVSVHPDRTVEDVAFWSLAYRITNHEDILVRRGLPERDPKAVSEWVNLLREDERAGYQIQPSTHRATGFQRIRAALTGACFDLSISEEKTAEDAWYNVKSFYGLGPFYATQVMSDVLDDETSPWGRDAFIPTALGSTRALFWLSHGELTRSSAISQREMVHDLNFVYRHLHDVQATTGGEPLTYVDIEHTLCEFSKYLGASAEDAPSGGKLRVYTPQVRPR
jgi:hypothetical protein